VAGGRVDVAMRERLAQRVALADPLAERAWTEVVAPATGELVGSVPRCGAEDVRAAVTRARRAQDAWAHRTFGERAAVFRRFHDLILERQEEVLDLLQLEAGKARKDAFEEVLDVSIVSSYYASNAERHLRPQRRQGAFPALTAAYELHQPLGVVGFIEPWNYPLTLAITDAIAALMAGNAAVLKPDQKTPFTALWGVELLAEAGLPDDLFLVVTGSGAELGRPLIEVVDYVCFTGSTAVGRQVASQAGERLIGCSLELGGKNALLVLADADLDQTVPGAARACFSNAGQLCISCERAYVHVDLYDEFRERFVEATRALRLGAALDYDSDVGSLVSEEQRDRVDAHVRDAVAKGARVLAGGRARPDLGPAFYEPTVLEGVTEDMDLFADETFGPVVALYRFESTNDAIERINASPYGLNASVWTRDLELGKRIAARLEVGTVNVNEAYAAAWASVDAPMGGFKASGLGRRHGAEGILKYTESQTVAVQRGLPIAAPAGIAQGTYSSLMSAALKLLHKVPGR
jgi:succinate-semialdehyde dehydrogenase/glutarate-semialdehyde dehydrogenase